MSRMMQDWLDEKQEEVEEATTAIADAAKALECAGTVECRADWYDNVREAAEALRRALEVCEQATAIEEKD